MTLNISISSEAEAVLRQKASAAGKDVATYAASVLERFAQAPPSLQEISGPLGDEVRASGLSEDQLGDLLEDAKHRMRRGRRAS